MDNYQGASNMNEQVIEEYLFLTHLNVTNDDKYDDKYDDKWDESDWSDEPKSGCWGDW